MKFKDKPDWMFFVLALILIMVSIGSLATDRPLVVQCQRHCWINALLDLVLGDAIGRVVFAAIGFLFAALSTFWALTERPKKE
jgi:hypothetical protein